MAAELDVLDELKSDESLNAVFSREFESKAFATKIIHYQAVGETLGKLSKGIAKLDDELYKQIVSHHEDLLSQATGIETLEGVLAMMESRISTLRQTLERVTTQVTEPYNKISTRTAQLARLQTACELLRKIIRLIYLIKRLKSLMRGGSKEIAKIAQTISEIDQVMKGSDLNGIQVIEDERVWLSKAHREVEMQAKKMLSQGLELNNPTQVGVAVQVFQSLGQFTSVLISFVEDCKADVQKEIQVALDPATLEPREQHSSSIPGRAATMPVMGSSSSWRATLWTRLEKLADSIEHIFVKVQQFQVVLERKKDPTSGESLFDKIRDSDAHKSLLSFWNVTTDNLALEFTTAARASPFLSQTFESDYPRLVVLFVRLLDRLEQQKKDPSRQNTMHQDQRTQKELVLLKAFSQFEKAYLSKSLSKLFDTINQMFSSSSRGPPTSGEVGSLVKAIAYELAVSATSEQLSLLIGKNVEKSIKMFLIKTEQMMMLGQNSLQLSAQPNELQIKNIHISNSLHYLVAQLNEEVLQRLSLSQSVHQILSDSAKGVVEQRERFLCNLLVEFRKILEVMIIRMHEEDFASDVGMPEAQCSSYIREIKSFINRISTEFLSKFKFMSDAKPHLVKVAGRLVDLFVRHVCLIRPLSESGRLRVTADIAQFEFALAPLCSRISNLGKFSELLHGMRQLLFLSTNDITKEEKNGLLGYFPLSYIILQFISRTPPQKVKSPLQIHEWSIEEFSTWLDKHESEQERLVVLKPSLEQLAKSDSLYLNFNEFCLRKLTS